MRRIGIDVGGTNTDAVLVEGDSVVASAKVPTSPDVTTGIADALRDLLRASDGLEVDRVDGVMVGTTHFTNAVVERRDLERVAAIRIGLPASAALPPFVDWPQDLAALVDGGVYMVAGGHEFDGRPIAPFDEEEMRSVARQIERSGVRSVAVAGVFSPLNPGDEEAGAAILRQHVTGVKVTLSHTLGRIGLLERENAAILNGSLLSLADRTFAAFKGSVEGAGIDSPLLVTLNDGTVASVGTVARAPVLCFASGPTNSMRGAAFLSGMSDALVIDVGGTTSDVGCLAGGFPREANNVVEVGGVRTLFRMPDLLSIGLGGGSRVSADGGAVGPASVGYRILEESRVFGGATVTATDIAVAAGWTELGDRSRLATLPEPMRLRSARAIHRAVTDAVDKMKSSAHPEPLIAVGGGAFLVPDEMEGVSKVVRVPHQGVANAVGAAMAQISGEADRIFQGVDRDDAIARATGIARTRAIEGGADRDTLVVAEVEDLPLAYLAGDARRVRVKVIGDVANTTE